MRPSVLPQLAVALLVASCAWSADDDCFKPDQPCSPNPKCIPTVILTVPAIPLGTVVDNDHGYLPSVIKCGTRRILGLFWFYCGKPQAKFYCGNLGD